MSLRVRFVLHAATPVDVLLKPGSGFVGQACCTSPSQSPLDQQGHYYDVTLTDGTGGVALTRAVCELTSGYSDKRWQITILEPA